MIGIVERLRFDAVRCEVHFSKGVATNIEEAAAEIERLMAAITRIDAINDNPACFNSEINDVCGAILRPHSPS